MTRSRLALALARPYIRRRLHRAFDGLHVMGLDAARRAMGDGPVVVAANHTCWWDAFTILSVDCALHGRGRCLMDADNLARLPFFRWVGAVPIDRSSPRQSLRDLSAACEGLCEAGDALWIFPQGEQRPSHIRPLGMHSGVAWLARKADVPILPLGISYLYREAPEPAIVASFGAPVRAQSRAADTLELLEREVIAALRRCDRFVLSGEGTFVQLVAPRRTQHVPFAGRLLSTTTPSNRSEHA